MRVLSILALTVIVFGCSSQPVDPTAYSSPIEYAFSDAEYGVPPLDRMAMKRQDFSNQQLSEVRFGVGPYGRKIAINLIAYCELTGGYPALGENELFGTNVPPSWSSGLSNLKRFAKQMRTLDTDAIRTDPRLDVDPIARLGGGQGTIGCAESRVVPGEELHDVRWYAFAMTFGRMNTITREFYTAYRFLIVERKPGTDPEEFNYQTARRMLKYKPTH